MSWTADTLATWTGRLASAFETWLSGVDARLARNNVGPTATAVGGALWQIDAKLEGIARDRFVHLAGEEALERHGADFGLPRRGATGASGLVTVASSGAASVAVDALMRRADGTRFRAVTSGSVDDAGTFSVSVVAVDVGTAGNTAAGSTLVVLSGIDGDPVLTVGLSGLSGGAELEEKEAYRARLLDRLAYPPQGGTTSDYWRWATAVDGCTDCFVWPRGGGIGRVVLFPIFDRTRPGGLPTADDLAAVREAVEASAPDGALIVVSAFTPRPVDVTIPGLTPSSRALQDAIETALINLFAARGRVSGGADAHPSFPMRATAATFSRSWIEETISRVAGEVSHAPIAPAADVVQADGERPVLRNIVFG